MPALSQVLPDQVMVHTCLGSCFPPHYSCRPGRVVRVKVEVMVTMSRMDVGEHETVCGQVEVETVEECECGCRAREEECVPAVQYYHQPSCSCLCLNQQERSDCLARGGSWSPTSCSCTCRPDSWRSCPSGHRYDYISTCSCVELHSRATLLYLTLIFLLALLLLSSLG